MGGGATRLYGSVALSGGPPVPPNPDRDLCQVSLEPAACRPMSADAQGVCLPQQRRSDPLELLRQCEEALGEGPPRLHRTFTSLSDGGNGPGPPIRVMQWNILAQGL